MLSFNNKFLQA